MFQIKRVIKIGFGKHFFSSKFLKLHLPLHQTSSRREFYVCICFDISVGIWSRVSISVGIWTRVDIAVTKYRNIGNRRSGARQGNTGNTSRGKCSNMWWSKEMVFTWGSLQNQFTAFMWMIINLPDRDRKCWEAGYVHLWSLWEWPLCNLTSVRVLRISHCLTIFHFHSKNWSINPTNNIPIQYSIKHFDFRWRFTLMEKNWILFNHLSSSSFKFWYSLIS